MKNLPGDTCFTFTGVYRVSQVLSDTTKVVWVRVLSECNLNDLENLARFRNWYLPLKIAHFIGVFYLCMHVNQKRTKIESKDFFTVFSFSLNLWANKKTAHKVATFRNIAYLCSHTGSCVEHWGELLSFDPSENLENFRVRVISLRVCSSYSATAIIGCPPILGAVRYASL